MNRNIFTRCIDKFIKKPSPEKQRELLSMVMADVEKADLSEKRVSSAFTKRLKWIDEGIIIDEIGMADMPLIMYILSLKHNGEIQVNYLEDDAVLSAGNLGIANMSYLAVYIHFVEVRNGCLCIEGNMSQPSIFKHRCTFGVEINDIPVPVEFAECGLDLKKGVNVYETRTTYKVEIPLREDMNVVSFYNYLDGNRCKYGRINSMRFAPIADCLQNQYCVREGWVIYIDGNTIHCQKATPELLEKKETRYMDSLRASNIQDFDWVASMREEYHVRRKNKTKPIWLFMDRVDRADDNAEALYRYVREKKEVDAYFIIQKGSQDYNRLLELGNIIDANSREHLMLVLLADYMISSQSNGVVENPFWEKSEYFRDLYHQPKLVFLQHGVTKDDMSSTLNKFYANFYGLVTSTNAEWQSIFEYPYFYDEKNVWLTGMPRFDYLYNNPQKYILLMPSWRKGLMEQKWDQEKNTMVWTTKVGFLESEYVKRYCGLLKNARLLEACKKHGYKIAFMPHALIEPYIELFIENEECIYWDASKSYRDAFAEGDLMITDYSSVAFDFAYLEKPILYYQFDKEQFFQEHTYQQGYFDYEEDGFGEVVYEEEILVDLIIAYMENGCALKPLYKDRIRNTYAYRDKNCCERVYEYLTK